MKKIDLNKPLELEDGTPCQLLEILPNEGQAGFQVLRVLILANVNHRLNETETTQKGEQNWWFYDIDGYWSGDLKDHRRGKKMLRNVEELV